MIHDIVVKRKWFDTWWQQYSTHLHTNNTQYNTIKQNTQNGTYIKLRILKHNVKNIQVGFHPFLQDTQALRVSRGVALLFSRTFGTRWGWGPAPRPGHLYPVKDPVPIVQKAGWAPGPVWTGRTSRLHRDSIPDRPARSQSLYRLSYRAHNNKISNIRKLTAWNTSKYGYKCFSARHEGLGEWRYSSTYSSLWPVYGGESSPSRRGRFTQVQTLRTNLMCVGPCIILITEE